jgi:hypothetical protein
MNKTAEHQRLEAHHQQTANWRLWGPYLSNRAWGTVREDYSETGDAWDYFPHDHARSRVYRWNEDGLAGISDRYQSICFALSLWNEQDPILKERLFGLNAKEGNHGEDVKEYYFYLDHTPTHSYMKMLYKYPHQAFPYERLIIENQKRESEEKEFELGDTGIFDNNAYFDIFVEYAKAEQTDLLIKISVMNRGREAAPCHLLPTLWFRNTWSWGYPKGPMNDISEKPILFENPHGMEAHHPIAGTYYLYTEQAMKGLFTENETNLTRLYQQPNFNPYVKDAFHRYLIQKETEAINPKKIGTKGAIHFQHVVESQETWTVRLRLSSSTQEDPFKQFESIFNQRIKEADDFYARIQSPLLEDEEKQIQRQAFAGLLWSKQFYYYDMEQWIEGDKIHPKIQRRLDRNKEWIHLMNYDVLSMPDKWEYPWYASWDLAFHMIPYALIDPDFTKRQLILMTREWYMHPNGQIPAYEWNFSDVNPPVLAWAAWRVYKIDAKQAGKTDYSFLEAIFHKLLLNFTWWVNQKDALGNNVFQGGFLGLDNISIFDRSTPDLDRRIDQADGTAWMGFYSILMMKISLELAHRNSVYQDLATKFFEHFLRIASAMSLPQRKGYSLWSEEDGFFYDALHIDHKVIPLKIRSLVGLFPLFAVETIEPQTLQNLPIYKRRMEWFLSQRPDYTSTMACVDDRGIGQRRLMSILTRERLVSILHYMLDENEFLSDYGIRSLSKYHLQNPYIIQIEQTNYCIQYQPGNSSQRHFAGGNSNWRGPIWFPINFLIIESLQKFHHYYGDSLKVEFPTRSGNWLNLWDIATELSKRLISLFIKNKEGIRPIYDAKSPFNRDPNWQNLILFHEFFDGETGLGLGASHQTGWTALVAKLLQQSGGEN